MKPLSSLLQIIALLWLSTSWSFAVFILNPYRFTTTPPPPPPGGDEHFASVVLLMHFEGADGSTTFTDSSTANRAMTAVGSTQIDTAQKKYGNAAGLFSSSSLTAAASNDFSFGTNDLTLEFFLRYNTNASFQVPFSLNDSTANLLRIQSGNTVLFIAGGVTIFSNSITTLANGVWYHLAITRSGNTWRLFVDGTIALTATASATVGGNFMLRIGDYSAGNFLNGWLDEYRITKGVARYTANFTPPTEAFPDS